MVAQKLDFPSTIIVSQNRPLIIDQINLYCAQLDNLLSPNNPDIFIIDESTGYSIDNIREIQKFFSLRPYNHTSKIAIIFDSQNLTHQAQSVLLKTLEEPGVDNYLILTTPVSPALLPTIISRCHLVIINEPFTKSLENPITFSINIQKNLQSVDEIINTRDKSATLKWLDNYILYYQQQLVNNTSPSSAQIIQKLIKAKDMINSNVDPRSSLDSFFIS